MEPAAPSKTPSGTAPARTTSSADYCSSRIDKNRKTRNHVRQLETLGYTVTLTHAA